LFDQHDGKVSRVKDVDVKVKDDHDGGKAMDK
jgi:hypothetical protein